MVMMLITETNITTLVGTLDNGEGETWGKEYGKYILYRWNLLWI